jgi:hypothetical protein
MKEEVFNQDGLQPELSQAKLCLEAVKRDGYNLQFIKSQTSEICLEAVRQNGRALYYVKNKPEKSV